MLLTFLKGFRAGSGLIIAIGAQNAFVLSQGVRRNHYIIIPLICTVCDALLTTLAVTLLNPPPMYILTLSFCWAAFPVSLNSPATSFLVLVLLWHLLSGFFP